MWRERDTKTNVPMLGAAVLFALAAGCTPDGPGNGVPTHPSDTWSVTLEWDAPTVDAVGRPLDDLSGYRLYYREIDDAVGAEVSLELGSDTRVTVTGLATGQYLFAVTALDTMGNESDLSEPLAVEVGP